jgi:hypothetical protein
MTTSPGPPAAPQRGCGHTSAEHCAIVRALLEARHPGTAGRVNAQFPPCDRCGLPVVRNEDLLDAELRLLMTAAEATTGSSS